MFVRLPGAEETLDDLIQISRVATNVQKAAKVAAEAAAKAEEVVLSVNMYCLSTVSESKVVEMKKVKSLRPGDRIIYIESNTVINSNKTTSRTGIIAASRPMTVGRCGGKNIYDVIFDDGTAVTGVERTALTLENNNNYGLHLNNHGTHSNEFRTRRKSNSYPHYKTMGIERVKSGLEDNNKDWLSLSCDSSVNTQSGRPPFPPKITATAVVPPDFPEESKMSILPEKVANASNFMDIRLEGKLAKTGSQDNRFKDRWFELKYVRFHN